MKKILNMFRSKKKDYPVVKDKSGFPVFVLELPPEVNSPKGTNETDWENKRGRRFTLSHIRWTERHSMFSLGW